MEKYGRSFEPWTREAVWRKLSTFCTVESLNRFSGRPVNNAKDILFAIKTAKGFLNRDDEQLALSTIANYYGAFWILSAIAMIENEEISLAKINAASSKGHGMNFISSPHFISPLDWRVFIQKNGFLYFLLNESPFKAENIDSIVLPNGTKKNDLEARSDICIQHGISLQALIERIPELSWQYERIANQPGKYFHWHTQGADKGLLFFSRLASADEIRKTFPHLDVIEKEDSQSRTTNYNVYKVKLKNAGNEGPLPKVERYSSLLTHFDYIIPMDKPIYSDLVRHLMLCYAMSIVARYMPSHLQEIENGTLSDWKPLLDEYNWFLRIRLPTACLNYLTKADWRFSPVSLWGG